MAVIAATALDRLTLATRIAGSAAAVDQGLAYSFAAEQIALRRVADLVARDPAKLTLAGNWLGRDFVLPLPGGQGTARSEEHTSELQSLMRISYAVFCLKKKTTTKMILSSSHSQVTRQTTHTYKTFLSCI